jgi:hypothetical protein
VRISDDWDFRPVEVGFGFKSFSFQNLLLEDQINIRSGINNSTSIDPALQSKIGFFDVSAGMVLVKKICGLVYLKHLNRPNIAFNDGGNFR